MKKLFLSACLLGSFYFSNAQINLGKATGALEKGVKALSFSNNDAKTLAKEAVDWMDENNPVAEANDPYAVRLERVFGNHKNEDGLALNYKVYVVTDINAFACADGSVRVFSSLMDILTDDELLAVIGHEIGHVKNEDTKDAMKAAYMKAAAMEAGSAASSTVATLNDSQVGEMASAMLDASHSRKQETQADTYSYDFMKKHNYNVVAAYTAFKKLALLSAGSDIKGFEKMMSSHPDSEKRANAIKAQAEKDMLWKDPGTVSLPTEPLTE
ncbi:MAG: M48 family metalloprotease [Flavobacteriaceae bacterium]